MALLISYLIYRHLSAIFKTLDEVKAHWFRHIFNESECSILKWRRCRHVNGRSLLRFTSSNLIIIIRARRGMAPYHEVTCSLSFLCSLSYVQPTCIISGDKYLNVPALNTTCRYRTHHPKSRASGSVPLFGVLASDSEAILFTRSDSIANTDSGQNLRGTWLKIVSWMTRLGTLSKRLSN